MAWNTTYNVLDSIHAGISGTLNELVAASLEVQHRGKYAWRKHTATDYTLDASRSTHELLNSPLSDERTAIMTRWQVQLMPLVLIQVTDGIGYRGAHGLYHEARIDLITTLLNTAKVRLSYSRSNGSNDFGFNLDLL